MNMMIEKNGDKTCILRVIINIMVSIKQKSYSGYVAMSKVLFVTLVILKYNK